MICSFFPSETGNQRTLVNELLKNVLAQGIAEAVYVPLRSAQGESVAPALVSDLTLLDQADPLAPLMLINGARAVSVLTAGGAPAPIAAVLRPCEIRALIELAKLKQASLERLIIIGIDCGGTYEVSDYRSLLQAGGDAAAAGVSMRAACQMCEYPAPANAQIVIGHIGIDGLLVEVDEALADKLHLPDEAVAPHPTLAGEEQAPSPCEGEGWGEGGLAPAAARRRRALDDLVRQRTARWEQEKAALLVQLHSANALAAYFATCQRCHNCMTACPICYCKECLFRTAAFEHEPQSYLLRAGRKGAARLPADTLLFHLTRLNHMSTSCVGCGMCESACPSDIPLTALFRSVAARTQALFDYVPGRRLDEQMPLMIFSEAELEGV